MTDGPGPPGDNPLGRWLGHSSPVVLLYQIDQGRTPAELTARFEATDDDLAQLLRADLTVRHGRHYRLTDAGRRYLENRHDVDAAGDLENW